jgi:hypothetical protein
MEMTVHARAQDDMVVQTRMTDVEQVHAWLKRGWNEIFMVQTEVSPSMAACLMEKNISNRAVVTGGAARSAGTYADAMKRGEWVINGETIVIASTGELNDGQHRLYAVIKAGIAVPMLLVFGVDRETRHTIDQGIARSAAHVLMMQGEKNTTNLATALRLLYQIDHHAGVNARPSTDELLATLEKHPGVREPALREAWRLNGLFQTSVGAIGAAYYLCLEHNKAKAETFFEIAVSGIGIENRDDPVAKLRTLYIEHYARQTRLSGPEHAANFIQAYNAFLDGRRSFKIWRAIPKDRNAPMPVFPKPGGPD